MNISQNLNSPIAVFIIMCFCALVGNMSAQSVIVIFAMGFSMLAFLLIYDYMQEDKTGQAKQEKVQTDSTPSYEELLKQRQAAKEFREKVDIVNAHDTLNINKTIQTKEELKQFYKQAAKKAHPDLGGSEEKMQRVIDAYNMLLCHYNFKK